LTDSVGLSYGSWRQRSTPEETMSAQNIQPGNQTHAQVKLFRDEAEAHYSAAEGLDRAGATEEAAAERRRARRLDLAAEEILFQHRYGF
jgi:uncharacterized ParB-like nuclease family protein